jgi:hypothetical protein
VVDTLSRLAGAEKWQRWKMARECQIALDHSPALQMFIHLWPITHTLGRQYLWPTAVINVASALFAGVFLRPPDKYTPTLRGDFLHLRHNCDSFSKMLVFF